jgi:predicted DsbA family dithiol-disulfide isomerase
VKVEVWSDIICPWCGLGLHRLDMALERFAHRDQVEVVHRSFQLDPTVPPGETTPVRDMLARKFGMDPDGPAMTQFETVQRRIESMAESEGLHPYNVLDNITGNTQQAHELLAYASTRGLHAEAWRRMYRAYFGERRSVFDRASLLTTVEELGLDRGEANAALDSGAFERQVREDAIEAQELGATGVPFFVIDRRYGIPGAQSTDILLGALQQAWHEAHPSTQPAGLDDATEAMCGPDGCVPPVTAPSG